MASSIEFLEKMWSNKNVRAAFETVRHTEGTSAPDGYNYLFSSSPRNTLRFTDMTAHPNQHISANGYTSTAAGAVQILYGTWVNLCKSYGFTGFSEHTQQLMFCALIDEANCLVDICKGYYLRDTVQTKMAHIWASQPMNTYNQPTHTIADVRAYYLAQGGTIG